MNSPTPLHANAYFSGNDQGLPVILIHGLGSSLRTWDFLIPALVREGCTVHALDLLGHGDSAKPPANGSYPIEAIYAHFFNWANRLGLTRPPVIVGHSMGGYLALNYALRAQKSPRSLFLLNPYYCNAQLSTAIRFSLRSPRLSQATLKIAPAWTIRKALRLLQRRGEKLPRPVRQQIADDFKRMDPHLLHTPHTIQDLTPQLCRLKLPIHIAWGGQDMTLAPDTFPTLCSAIPHSGHEILPGGHVPHLSHPDEINAAIIRFLRQTAR